MKEAIKRSESMESRGKQVFPAVTSFLVFMSLIFVSLHAQESVRIEPKIPDILGYRTLLCDFHIHTAFSDGSVWPTVRVQEAWMEGLDAISITDHLEYLPHKNDIKADHNRPHEIALPYAELCGLILIRGTEITKQVPPGHFNAIFLEDANPVFNDNYLAACSTAAAQGGFVFWNHPRFGGNVKDGEGIWHPEHTAVLQKGWLHGIEVANGRDYYPESQRWAMEKGLTMVGNTDIHNPISFEYNRTARDYRTMTLVFAADNSAGSIKEALLDRRTAVYVDGSIYGEEKYLKPLFTESVDIVNARLTIKGKERAIVRVRNASDVPYTLTAAGEVTGIRFPERLTLEADATVILPISCTNAGMGGTRNIGLPYRVTNLQVAPDRGLDVSLPLEVTFR